MRRKKEVIAMLLAGGEGTRLAPYTSRLAKPAVPFGGKYRIIDFSLSNCINSGITTVGVLTQYRPLVLNRHLGTGGPWDLHRKDGGLTVLPPFVRHGNSNWYLGTADAIYQNIEYMEQYNPEYVLIISGDHIYSMDYSLLLEFHKKHGAEVTISTIEVPWREASRFGIVETGSEMEIVRFQEKPAEPSSNLASMGIYMFNWPVLKELLLEDAERTDTSHDFGKDLLPRMLATGRRMYAYPFRGYWKDVGTLESLWQANMDLVENDAALDLFDPDWPIFSVNYNHPPVFLGEHSTAHSSLLGAGSWVDGSVTNCVLSYGAVVEEGAVLSRSVIMPGARIGRGVRIHKAMVGEGAVIGEYCEIGSPDQEGITVVDSMVRMPEGSKIL